VAPVGWRILNCMIIAHVLYLLPGFTFSDIGPPRRSHKVKVIDARHCSPGITPMLQKYEAFSLRVSKGEAVQLGGS
jgi:hypothetical protein